MIGLPIEKQIILYECVMETARILEFETFNKIFYCGPRFKFNVQNTLLIVISADEANIFFEEMNNEYGSSGTAYLNSPSGVPWEPKNLKYTWHYKVITEEVYAGLNNDWTRLADFSWAQTNNIYMPGLDVTDTIQRYHNLKVFL